MKAWAGILLALGLAAPAAAHRGHASLVVVEIDARSGAVAVTHRMAAHDVEPALVDIAPDAQPSLDDPAAVKALVAYVGRTFRIAGVPLTATGQRLAGDTVILTYTGELKGKPSALTISGTMFGETHPDHTTQVNVRRAGVTRTLHFGPGDSARSVELSR